MEKLTDFKPLEEVVLPGIGELDTSGLILIVGPNSSGKTQLLQDLYHRVAGLRRDTVVAEKITIAKPDYAPFIKCLKSEGYLSQYYDDEGTAHLRPRTSYLGMGSAPAPIPLTQAEQWHGAYDPARERPHRKQDFLNYFGRLLVTALFLERRLTAAHEVPAFDYETEHPQQDLHVLRMDEYASRELTREVLASFSRGLWLDVSRGKIWCFRVSDGPEVPSAEDRDKPGKMAEYRTIQSEGDGLKSYVATCVALLLGRRPVCIIDEPEMCLHPPQAYNLGRFIGRFGASTERATFVATHSSHVLRGIIQTAEALQIVRLDRRSGEFVAHLVSSKALAESIKKPTVRAETVLDGIFAQGAVIVEGDGDRTVYQATWETLTDEFTLDLHFAAVGGLGGFADTCRLYRTLRIPTVAIADLDLVVDPDRLLRVLDELDDSLGAWRTQIENRARQVAGLVRELPPTLTADQVKEELGRLAAAEYEWEQGDDGDLRREISKLSNRLDRLRDLKRGGVSKLPDEIGAELKSLLADLASVGLFLVPSGELEDWLSDAGIEASRNSKWAWANEAAAHVRSQGPSDGDIWDFMRNVGQLVLDELAPSADAQ